MPDLFDHLVDLARAHIVDDAKRPVRPPVDPETLRVELDLGLGSEGRPLQDVAAKLAAVLRHTPSSTSTRFFNQLFAGRDDAAVLADMLASLTNNSMYTYKVAGPHILIEQEVISRMLSKAGFDAGEGMFTPGGSMSNLAAIAMARQRAIPESRDEGLGGVTLRAYVSDEGHYSVAKNASILSLGRRHVRRIETDDDGRMKVDALVRAIVEDKRAGHVPFLIVATAGTTVQGAFDPLTDLSAVADEHGLWLHVDAAFGGTVLLSEARRHLMAGCERADSITWDAHKLMGVPLTSSVILTRERGHLLDTFAEPATYLFQGSDPSLDPGLWSLQCGRRNDALKLWAAWQHHGDRGYESRVEHLYDLAAAATRIVEADPDMVLSCVPQLVNVCFEVGSKSSEAICDALHREARALVGYATVNGRRVVRVVFAHVDMTVDDVRAFFEEVRAVAASLPDADNALLQEPVR